MAAPDLVASQRSAPRSTSPSTKRSTRRSVHGSSHRHRGVLAAASAWSVVALLALTGCSSAGSPPSSLSTTPSSSSTSAADGSPTPALRVEVVSKGLEHPWDVGFLPDGRLLVTERAGRITLLSRSTAGAQRRQVRADLSDVYASGEGGLMGLLVHPDFANSRQFTTCATHAEGGDPVDIRLVTWTLSADGSSAQRSKDLLTGLPLSSGRHSGCRMAIGPDGALLVGTGDTARAGVSQDRTSLGGKLLRLDLATGKPLPDNPFAGSNNVAERLVATYGHRNIQGVAVQPGTGAIYTAEHGPSSNDEVNKIAFGKNYGWDPSRGGTQSGYDESVPMTDLERFPDAVPAVWESGESTQAICGAAFVRGSQWGEFDGALVITALKGAKLLILKLAADGTVARVVIPKETNGPFGRLRAAQVGSDGALYVTTSNGVDDHVLRITPA